MKNTKITILMLHLQFGGIEKQTITFANELSKKYDVKIISTYSMNSKPAYEINKNNENLEEYIPGFNFFNRMCFWMATASGKTIVIIKLMEIGLMMVLLSVGTVLTELKIQLTFIITLNRGL